MTDQLRFICVSLRRIHDDARSPFPSELWDGRAAIARWMAGDAYVASRLETAHLPTFLHGGSPTVRSR